MSTVTGRFLLDHPLPLLQVHSNVVNPKLKCLNLTLQTAYGIVLAEA
jgi:hypothetical protein